MQIKKTYAFLLIISLSLISFNNILAQEIRQEPEPPKIPEPTPEPEPIKLPEPEPIPEPFPGETESEKIQRLTKENEELKHQNSKLKSQIFDLQKEKSTLELEIMTLNEKIEKLKDFAQRQDRTAIIQTLQDLISTYHPNRTDPDQRKEG